MVVHGIPGPYALKRGDLISIDIGVTKDGWVADGAVTVPIGRVGRSAEKLLDVTKAALFAGVGEARPGNRLGDVSHAIQLAAEDEGLSIIRTLVGHGVGRDMHEDPQIPNFGEPGHGPELEAGMVLAIEPMVNAGGPRSSARRGRLGRLLRGRLAGGALRVHRRHHGRRPAHPHPLARGLSAARRLRPRLARDRPALLGQVGSGSRAFRNE